MTTSVTTTSNGPHFVDERESFAGQRRSGDRVSLMPEHDLDETPDRLVVLDEQHALAAAVDDAGVRKLASDRNRVDARQKNLEDRSASYVAAEGDPTIALLHDPEHRGQPEPCSFARPLRREEGLEDVLLHLL